MFGLSDEANIVFKNPNRKGRGKELMAENNQHLHHHFFHDATPLSKKPAAAKRKPAAAKRKPAARQAQAGRAPHDGHHAVAAPRVVVSARRRPNETREAASAQARAARITAEQGISLAERAALTYIGATLEARDRIVGTASDASPTRSAPARRPRRSSTSSRVATSAAASRPRNQLERDVKKARTRLERVVRRNRTAVERDAAQPQQRRDGATRGRLLARRGCRPGRRRHRLARRHDRQGPRRFAV